VSLSLFVVATLSWACRPLLVVPPCGPPKIDPKNPPEWLMEFDHDRESCTIALSCRSMFSVALKSNFTDARITHKEIGDHLEEVPRDRDVLVYCKSGARSRTAIGALRAAGFTRLFNLEGGLTAWVDPPVSRY